MIKKFPIKRVIAIIIIVILNVILVLINKYNNVETIQKTSLSITEKNGNIQTIFNTNEKKYEINEINVIILYNTIMIPMNEVFIGIFGESYKANSNQTLKYKNMNLEINYNDLKINIPNENNELEFEIDNSIEIEIENINDIKYIPLYLISNLNGVLVKIDNKVIYDENYYTSSIDAFNNGKYNHKIEIETNIYENNVDYTYCGQNLGALWREEALKRIEKYRKKNTYILIKNQSDNLINNAKINIKNNEFKFGTTMRGLSSKKLSRKYFNLIGSEGAFKWRILEQNGYNEADGVVYYASNKKMDIRGHCLWWDYVCSTELKAIVGEENNFQEGTMAYVYMQYSNKTITYEQAEKESLIIQKKFEEVVLKHIEEVMNHFKDVSEWDVVNELLTQEYFKYYLYDRNYLTDKSFLTNTNKGRTSYADNIAYYKFIAKCFDKAREINSNSRLVINDNIVNGAGYRTSEIIPNDINIIKNIIKYTNNVDCLGVQYHVDNNYNSSPQSYYNMINNFVKQTSIQSVAITEYNNYLPEKKGKYSTKEIKAKADLLRDSLIMAYSNKNIVEFSSWVYSADDYFEDEERAAYEKLVGEWLNYSTTLTSSDFDGNGYNTRLYKGDYTATITLNNGKTKRVDFKVSDNNSDTVEIAFESEIENIDIAELPTKTTYFQNGADLDLTGGKINVYFDDETVSQVDLNSSDVTITGFNNSALGKDTITVTYKNKKATFDVTIVENVSTKKLETLNSIKSEKGTVKNNNTIIYSNTVVLRKYNELITTLNKLLNNIESDSVDELNNLYQKEFDTMQEVLNQYYLGNIKVTEDTLSSNLKELVNITEKYKTLYSYYTINDNIDIQTTVKTLLNRVIYLYNDNIDIDLTVFEKLINIEKDIYQNSLQTDNIFNNYVNKQFILKASTMLSEVIDTKLQIYKKEEKSKLKITTNTDLEKLTNKDIIITLKHGNGTTILNNNGEDTYTFTKNGEFTFKVKIKDEQYNESISVKNIDKESPIISGVDNNKTYYSKVSPVVQDANLQDVKVIYNGQEITYTKGVKYDSIGSYSISATDKAGNKTTINFTVTVTPKTNYYIKDNYVLGIPKSTKVEEFKNKFRINTEYKILRKNKEIQNTSINIATGDILKFGDKEYTLVVSGDINSDGETNIRDLVMYRYFLINAQILKEPELKAADLTQDGTLNIKDLIALRLEIIK